MSGVPAGMVVDHTNIGAALRRLSLPIAYSMVGDNLLGIVDTIVIGSLGTVALAGVTGAFAIFIAVLFALLGFGSGISIMAAQRIGAGDLAGFGATVRAGFLAPMLGALVAIIASSLFALPLLRLTVGELPSLHASATYLILRCISLVPIMISVVIMSALGAAGNRRPQVIALILINSVHLPLVFILTRGWLTHHAFGIAGAGISSLSAECVAALYLLYFAITHREYAIFARLQVDLRLAMQTALLSLPEVVFLLAVLAPDVFIVAMLAPLGPAVISGFRALNIVSDMTFIAPIPLMEAVQTVIGQRLGARDIPGARAFLAGSLRISTRITTVGGLLCAIFSWPLAFTFTLNAQVATLAAIPLALHMLTLPLKGYSMVAMAPIRAAGDTRFSMLVGLLCSALVLPIAWFGIRYAHIGLYAVPLGWIVAWSARALLTQVRLRSDDWTTRELATP